MAEYVESETDAQRMREFAAASLLALEELRQAEGVDEWDEAHWRTLAYNDAVEVLGEDRAHEVISEAYHQRLWNPDDLELAVRDGLIDLLAYYDVRVAIGREQLASRLATRVRTEITGGNETLRKRNAGDA